MNETYDDLDGIPYDDFLDNEDDMYGEGFVGKKSRHISGIEGVVTGHSEGYFWLTHSGGQVSFIHGGELSPTHETPTADELESYLGHNNGFEKAESVQG